LVWVLLASQIGEFFLPHLVVHAKAALFPRKEPLVPFGQEAGWPQPVWTTWRPYRYWNSDPSAAQPVASHYTDCVTAAPEWHERLFKSRRYPNCICTCIVRLVAVVQKSPLSVWLCAGNGGATGKMVKGYLAGSEDNINGRSLISVAATYFCARLLSVA
jgi:hypothetical protein